MATRTVLTTTQTLDSSSYVDYRIPGGLPPVIMSGDVFPELVLNPRPTVNYDGYKSAGGSCTLGINPGGGILVSKRSATTAGICTYINAVQNKRHEVNVKVRTSSATPVKVSITLRISVKATPTSSPSVFKEMYGSAEIGQTAKTMRISWDGKWTGAFDSAVIIINGPATSVNLIVDECSVLLPVANYQPTIGVPHLQVSGENITHNGNIITLAGANIISYYDSGTPESFYAARSVDYRSVFKDMADMGMNCARWCTWYAFFEADTAPGVWIESGFDYLKSVITRARNEGIILILDMHHPQGGYQAPGYSGGFWSNTAQQTRLKNLWVEIARRFKDEPYLIFDLINEPNAGSNTAQMTTYFSELVTAIRTVDQNHLIIVEANYGSGDYCGIINDPKIIYDTHCYPNVFANQYSYQQCSNFMGSYPSPTKALVPWDIISLGKNVGQTSVAANATTGWSDVSYDIVLPTDPNGIGPNFIRPIVSTSNTGGVLLDKMQIFEGNNLLLELQLEVSPSNVWDPVVWKSSNTLRYTFAQTSPMISMTKYWSSVAITAGATGTKANYTLDKLNGKSCINIVSTSGEYGVTCKDIVIPIDKTKTYRIVATVKPLGVSTLPNIKVGADVLAVKYEADLATIDSSNLIKFLEVSNIHAGTPTNIGEVGWNSLTFISNGGDVLLGDAIDYLLANNLHFQWFAFAEPKYGIYYGSFSEYPTEGRLVNQKAINMFKTKLLKP